MAQILDIDDPLWKTDALRCHEIDADIEGFHRAPGRVSKRVALGETEPAHLEEIYAWIMDESRPGKAYIYHVNERIGDGRGIGGARMMHSYFHFTDANLALEFRMTWI